MGRLAPLGIAVLIAASVGCARAIRVEFDPSEDFARYRSWDWLPVAFVEPARGRGVSPEFDAELRAAVEHELAARGFERASGREPDFFVSYHADLSIELVVGIETPAAETLPSLHQTPSFEVGASQRRAPRRYDEGTLAVDVADGRDRQLVWRGMQTGRWRNGIRTRLAEAVAAIFERFPPPRRASRPDGDA